jgi:hypothetical protein
MYILCGVGPNPACSPLFPPWPISSPLCSLPPSPTPPHTNKVNVTSCPPPPSTYCRANVYYNLGMFVYLPYPYYLKKKKRAAEKEKQTGMNITICVYGNEHESFNRFYIFSGAAACCIYLSESSSPPPLPPPPPRAPPDIALTIDMTIYCHVAS